MPCDSAKLQARAELYLCLARAFLTPDGSDAWDGLREALADDLEELGQLLDHEIATHVAEYRVAIAAIGNQATLLQTYSTLFLAPPRRTSINTGTYLDGALNGGSVLAMEEAYRRGGVERSDEFKDLADHVAVQLEFVAYRFLAGMESAEATRDAEVFLAKFVSRWLPAFITDLENEHAGPNPWLHLARIMRVAVARDARDAGILQPAAQLRQQAALEKARHARAQNGIGDEDMAFIAARLREKGLAVDHLATPPEQRDEAQGWTRKVPPSPRRGSRLG